MLPEYQSKSNIGIATGFVMQVAGSLFGGPLGMLLLLGGLGVFLWGCVCYAQGKGQSGLWGLLGLTSLLGLIILVFLPDHHK